MEGQGWIVTWCVGHLVELVEPHEYHAEWKRWSLQTLPMLPEQFQLRAVERSAKQYNIVRKLLLSKEVTEVINACDAGREGELIFRYAYTLAGAKAPVRRLWISSMTDTAIKDGLAHLRPSSALDALYDAARCRSEADWLVGLNATRGLTVHSRSSSNADYKASLYSVGRVQTPTLAVLVDRERDILKFVPEDYWHVDVIFEAPKGRYKGRWFRIEAPPHAKIVSPLQLLDDAPNKDAAPTEAASKNQWWWIGSNGSRCE